MEYSFQFRKQNKTTPTCKEDSKLECSNHRPISLLSNIEEILKRLRYITAFKEKVCFMFSLQFGFPH